MNKKRTQSTRPTDLHFKKTVTFSHYRHTLNFHVAQALFSSHQVDIGTARLLRTLQQRQEMTDIHKVLDLGCGYGPLGLTLKALAPHLTVHLVDRDALALDYTVQNAALNQLGAVDVYGSLGYDDVRDHDFDLVISNIPGKAGETAIAHMVLDAQYVLRPGGYVALVIVAPLVALVTELLQQPTIEILFQETRTGHAIFHYRFAETVPDDFIPMQSALDRGVYDREELSIALAAAPLTMHTARGLPEFDSLSYQSRLLLKTLLKLDFAPIQHVLALNPGQGFIPLALWDTFRPQHFHLVSRDLLSLRYTAYNLLGNGCMENNIAMTHQVGLETVNAPTADLITYPLRRDESATVDAQTIAAAATHLHPAGTLLVVGGSTSVTRLLKPLAKYKHIRVVKRKKDKGQSLLILKNVG